MSSKNGLCPECDGDGILLGKTCTACSGTGEWAKYESNEEAPKRPQAKAAEWLAAVEEERRAMAKAALPEIIDLLRRANSIHATAGTADVRICFVEQADADRLFWLLGRAPYAD